MARVIYIPIFKTGLAEALFNFLSLLKNIFKGQNLMTDCQMYAMI